jgi:hypothetical protein
MYQTMPAPFADSHVRRIEDGAVIPFDPFNRDYQEFKRWQDAGGQVDPAPKTGD